MKISVMEDKKSKFIFELEGMGHTFLNALKTELWNDEHIKIATYTVRHPIISKPKFVLETDGNSTPRAALLSAISRLKKASDKLKKDLAKEL